ncbi:MAG TPA: HEAT repeat domain-containing protein [Pirellulales bacterium]|nr:HEAT repeat domain-containing protein [Pirellulales bacterium]
MKQALAAAVLIVGLSSGCQAPWRTSAAKDAVAQAAAGSAAATDRSKTAPGAAATKAAGAASDPAAAVVASPESAAAGAAALADDRWVQAVAAPGDPAPLAYRWRHFGLEAWLARGTWQTELAEALGNSQRVVAANGAIVLARDGSVDAGVVPALVAAIDDVNLRLPLRFAAVEALSCIPTTAAQNELARLADQQSQFLRTAPSAYTPQMHAELLIGLARSHGSADLEQANPRFAAGLISPAPDVRRVALAAWLEPERKGIPPLVLELRRDPDPRVRVTALAVLAVQRPPQAETLLLAALEDTDLTVRIAAIEALGKLGTPAARTALDKLRSHSHEAARVASVRALSRLAGCQAVIASAHDKSWRVRQAVAESMSQVGETPSSENVELAQSFVHDPSLDVQRQMIQSLAAWPLRESGPVLLSAMGGSGYQTRKDAAAQLAGRWPAAAEFPVEALAPERAASIATLTARWNGEFAPQAASLAQQTEQEPATTNLAAKELARLRQLVDVCGDGRIIPSVRQTALDSLVAYGAALPGALESPEFADHGPLPEVLYEEVLPKVSPLFAALDNLNSGDLRLRRSGATRLLAAIGGKAMSALALDRLVVLARRETDPVVWQCLLQATAGDARGGAVQLAYLAVGNSSSDVRRRACDYLAAHPDARHVAVLLPMLQDSSSTVVIAAVRGLGAGGMLDDPRPLAGLLLAPNRELRLEAAENLVRLKVEDGRAALARMAFEPDMQLRLDVAQRMGKLGEPDFVPTLVQMSAEPNDVGRTAMESLAKLTGQDFSHDAEGTLLSRDAQAAQWQAWHRRQQIDGTLPIAGPETASADAKVQQ